MPSNMTGTDMRKDSEAAYTAPDVVENVSQHLTEMQDKIGSEPSIPEPPASPAEPPESTSEPEPESGPESKQEPEPESEPEPEPTDEDDSTPAEPEGAAAESDSQETPAIPDNWFRAATHSGYTSEQISKMYDADAEGTMKFLKHNYEAVNNLSRQYANNGRIAIELQQKAQAAQAVPAQQPTAQPPKMDAEKFRQQYEDNPAEAIFELFQGLTSSPQEKIAEQPAAQTVQSDRAAFEERVAILQQFHQFFTAEDMNAYKDFYGEATDGNMFDWSKLPPGQYANRQALSDLADQIIAGHELQGKQISVAEGLKLAHLAITQPITEQVVREKLVKQMKKRSKGVTLKPSGAQPKPATGTSRQGGAKTYEQAEANLQQRLPAMREKLDFTRL